MISIVFFGIEMNSMRFCFYALLCCACIIGCNGKSYSQKNETATFLEDFPKAVDAYLIGMRSYQAKATSVLRDLGDQKILGKKTVEYRQNGVCGLILFDMVEDDKMSSVANVLNSKYGFRLSRKGENSWLVKEITPIISAETPDIFGTGKVNDPILRMMSPYWIWNFWLPDILNPQMVRNVSSFEQDGVSLVRVEYEFKDPRFTDRHIIHKGSAIFIPSRNWVIKEFDHTIIKDKVESHERRQTDYTEGEFPLMRGFTTIKSWNKPGPKVEEVWTFDFINRAADENEFRLSAFGLSEPSASRRTNNRFIWTMSASAFFFVLALFFWRFKKQRSSGPSANSKATVR